MLEGEREGLPVQGQGRDARRRDAAKLKEGLVAGKAQIQVKLKGANVDMPDLPLALPVLVQLKNSDGVCWETTHSAPAAKNDDVQYKDKND